VVTTRRTRAFHHFTLGGDLSVENDEVLAESVEEVTCRWCGSGKSIEELPTGPLPAGTAPDPGGAEGSPA